MAKDEFIKEAVDVAGFTEEQAEFMWCFLSKISHTHGLNDLLRGDE